MMFLFLLPFLFPLIKHFKELNLKIKFQANVIFSYDATNKQTASVVQSTGFSFRYIANYTEVSLAATLHKKKMSKKMSIIELSRIGQDLFDFSDLT